MENSLLPKELAEMIATRQRRERAWHARLMLYTTVISNINSTLAVFVDEIEKEEAAASKAYIQLAIANFAASDSTPSPPSILTHSRPTNSSGSSTDPYRWSMEKMLTDEVERACSIRPAHVKLYGRNKEEAPHRTWMAYFTKAPRSGFRNSAKDVTAIIPQRIAPEHLHVETAAQPTTQRICAGATTKCRNCRGPHRSDSRRFLAGPTRAGAPTKEQMKIYRQAGEREYQAILRAKVAEESASSAEINKKFRLATPCGYEGKLENAKFRAKPKTILSPDMPLMFNGCVVSQEKDNVVLRQKEQGEKLKVINAESSSMCQDYVEQRARSAYISLICQPEATFDLYSTAQHKESDKTNVTALNKRIKWQMKNLNRKLNYIALDLPTMKIYVFIDGSFANTKDLSSQLVYFIVIANEALQEDRFTIKGNLIHWSSTKSKRVTHSVLLSEILAIVLGVDLGLAIGSTLNTTTQRISLPRIPLVVCTDYNSLYDYFVKLGSTSEKCLMVDIMQLRQS
ncbi:hypothetical protein EPUL_005361 [Erysiphe pulchra]|uniref:Uncharacterized protein n=1 Tax=Erysiphe pulchra TaxID=225359 RepID=A0A2S4PLZ6_9PEZI|nr:hypothetical protein EPUL_005361 [Erysiphe pulchra]